MNPLFIVYNYPKTVNALIIKQIYGKGCVTTVIISSVLRISANPLIKEVVIPESKPEAQGKRKRGNLISTLLKVGETFLISFSSRFVNFSIS